MSRRGGCNSDLRVNARSAVLLLRHEGACCVECCVLSWINLPPIYHTSFLRWFTVLGRVLLLRVLDLV